MMHTRPVGHTTNFAEYPKANSLNAIRLVLATLVIVSHSWPLGGFGVEPSLGGANLGTWAVFGFFGISGFLIMRSRLSNTASDFYRSRILRLVPGFVVALLMVAVIFAPFSTVLDPAARYSWHSAAEYVIRNLPMYPPRFWQLGIDNTLAGVPYPRVWDGPLWTLFWEACCYIVVGVLASVAPRRLLGPVLVIVFLGLTVLSATGSILGHGDESITMHVIALGVAFAAGALVYLYGRTVPTIGVLVVCLAVLVPVCLVGEVMTLAPAPLTLILLTVGVVLPLRRVGATNDMSYGIYIYGWPVQQTVALSLNLPLMAYIATAVVGVVPFAYVSCKLIEQPALRLKHRGSILPVRAAYRRRADPGGRARGGVNRSWGAGPSRIRRHPPRGPAVGQRQWGQRGP